MRYPEVSGEVSGDIIPISPTNLLFQKMVSGDIIPISPTNLLFQKNMDGARFPVGRSGRAKAKPDTIAS
jgi:hypothetical protein